MCLKVVNPNSVTKNNIRGTFTYRVVYLKCIKKKQINNTIVFLDIESFFLTQNYASLVSYKISFLSLVSNNNIYRRLFICISISLSYHIAIPNSHLIYSVTHTSEIGCLTVLHS